MVALLRVECTAMRHRLRKSREQDRMCQVSCPSATSLVFSEPLFLSVFRKPLELVAALSVFRVAFPSSSSSLSWATFSRAFSTSDRVIRKYNNNI